MIVRSILQGAISICLSLTLCMPTVLAQNHMLNIRDADIRTLIEAVSDATGRNFIVDPRVKGQVTVISARPLDKDALYETFLSVLQINDFAAVPAGNVIKIVPEANARTMAEQHQINSSTDALVTEVVALNHVPASQVVPLLRPLLPQEAQLMAYERGNLLIISDHAANVSRVVNIVHRMDIGSEDSLEIMPLSNAKADEVAKLVLASRGPVAAGTAGIMVIPDVRTNSVLVGGAKSERLTLRALVSLLDAPPAPSAESKSQWIRLKHAKATQVAGMLKEYAAAGDKSAGRDPNVAPSVVVLPDESANALLLRGTPEAQDELRAIIKDMDAPRSQVLVEAIIAEVNEDTSRVLGLEWASALRGVLLFSDFPNTLGATLEGALPALSGTSPNLSMLSIPEGGTVGGAFSKGEARFLGILRALASDTRTHILSTPSIVTLDHQEAQISVGQEVPFITGSFAATGASQGAANPFQTLERKDVGLKLRITPHILDNDSMELSIYQEVSSLAPSSQAADVITNKRTLDTQVQVENDQVIGLGGLIDERNTENNERIPVLGSLPLVGTLFRGTKAQHTQQNLMIFVRTQILPDLGPLKAYSEDRLAQFRLLETDIKNKTALRNKKTPASDPRTDDHVIESKSLLPALDLPKSDPTVPAAPAPSVPPASTKTRLRPFGPGKH